jgi:hypothetical protein
LVLIRPSWILGRPIWWFRDLLGICIKFRIYSMGWELEIIKDL